MLSYGALCRGLLSGRMTAETRFDGDDLRKVDPKFQGERFRQYLAAVEELKKLARERFGKSVLALAVRWVLDQGPTIALWGARRPDQLDPIDEIDGWHIDEASKAGNRCDPEALHQGSGVARIHGAAVDAARGAGARDGLREPGHDLIA